MIEFTTKETMYEHYIKAYTDFRRAFLFERENPFEAYKRISEQLYENLLDVFTPISKRVDKIAEAEKLHRYAVELQDDLKESAFDLMYAYSGYKYRNASSSIFEVKMYKRD